MKNDENKVDILRDILQQGRTIELNERQKRVYDALSAYSKEQFKLSNWYFGALHTIHLQNPDYMAQAANSIREISEKLPEFSGINQPESPNNKVKEVVKVIEKIKLENYPDGWDGKQINYRLSQALNLIDGLNELYNAPPRTRMLQTLLEKNDRTRELLPEDIRKIRDDQFKELGRFFQSVTHHKRFPNHEDFLNKLSKFENLILYYLTPVTASQNKEIQQLIDSPITEDSKTKLKELWAHNSANLLYFYSKVENPEWIDVMKSLGFFKQLRGAEQNSEGDISYRLDPALSCLSRLAYKAPENTLSILKKLPRYTNPHIPNQIMRCIAGIEKPSLVKECLALVKKTLKQSKYDGWIWIEDILKTWIRINCISEVIQLIHAYALHHLNSRVERNNFGNGCQFGEIDRSFVRPLIQTHSSKLARMLFQALQSWKKQQISIAAMKSSESNGLTEGKQDNTTGDPSDYWLEDFKSRNSLVHEFEEILATRLFEIGSVIFSKGDEKEIKQFDDMIRSDSWKLFNRLRWQLYADFPEHTLEWARADFLQCMPMVGHISGAHGFEMAQMLENHTAAHGVNFLNQDEVKQFCRFVMDGPINYHGELDSDEKYAKYFCYTQLFPISSLLNGQARQTYDDLAKDRREMSMASYKPFSSSGGMSSIEFVAPINAENMADMPDDELWMFLNTWTPEINRYSSENLGVEECLSALGDKFADLLVALPQRFIHSDQWWCNLFRPAILSSPLKRATERITRNYNKQADTPDPTEDEWRNWFGLVTWIVDWAENTPKQEFSEYSLRTEELDWIQSGIITVRFLKAAINSSYDIPPDLKPNIGRILCKLVVEHDPRFTSKDNSMLHDWLMIGTNSVSGSALEGLIELGVHQKKTNQSGQAEEWIWQTIVDTLTSKHQSPAVYAIMGARLHPLLYLFAENIKKSPNLLMPDKRPECIQAFVLAHVKYGNPVGGLLSILPNFSTAALDCLSDLNSKQTKQRDQNDNFGGRLGTHFAFYYWNNSFSCKDVAENTIESYFEIADKSQRANVIWEMSRIFSGEKSDEEKELYNLVTELWEKRFAIIKAKLESKAYKIDDVREELGAFVLWLGCECLPFDWRHKHVLAAINLLKEAPNTEYAIPQLYKYSLQSERLSACLEILEKLLEQENEFAFWRYDDRKIKPMLIKGINSKDETIRNQTTRIQEILLRAGQFNYLELIGEVSEEM